MASVTPGNLPWPGGIVPYEMDGTLTAAQQGVYLDGLREWELAGAVHFVPRTNQADYVLFKYSPTGPNRVSGSRPQLVEINLLTRAQICHEMGHSLGLEHEHQRPGRDTYVTVLYDNIIPGNNAAFDILPDAASFGGYDFESVMHYGRDVLSVSPGLDTIVTNPGYGKYQVRLSNFALSPVDRAHLASLYGPPTAALSAVVTTTADGGAGSLRAAIYYVQDHPGTAVTFNIPTGDPGYANGIFTIRPTGHLPLLASNGLTIDATTQHGYAGKPVVFVSGAGLPVEAGEIPAFLLYAANCTIRGLGVQAYPWNAVVLRYGDATGNRIAACSLGVDGTGGIAVPNIYQGLMIADGAHDNFIGGSGAGEGNQISGNAQYGIWISGADTRGNVILGNRIGTNAAGDAALPNSKGGIILTGGAHDNVIGGGPAGARNLISGNTDAGIWIAGGGTDRNVVSGNHIGINAAGNSALPNTGAGIYVVDGASGNTIAENVISGNGVEGLRIADTGTTGNVVTGNRVGTDPGGDSAIPNGFAGVAILFGASGNRVGGLLEGEGNLLSGNGSVGLSIGGVGTSGNQAFGNRIGTAAAGMAAVPNGFGGIYLTGGCSGNFIGDGPASGNLISGNATVGVLVADPGTTGNFVRNNRIGPDAAGGSTLAQSAGMWLSNGSTGNLIGGVTEGAANIIRGNSGRGITLYDAPTAGQTISRNSISDNGDVPLALFAGSNHGQTPPVLATATLGLATAVSGSLQSSPGTVFTLELFASPAAANNGGRTFIGSATTATDGGGAASFNIALPAIVAAGNVVTATATSVATGDTSEYAAAVTVTSTDSDGDGLPDVYEATTPGLNAAITADATLDNDGDGFSNLREFIAGTDPNDSGSRLVCAGIKSGGIYQVKFATMPGRIYRLERSADLAAAWEMLAVNIEGTGGTVTVAVPVSANHGFFRVGTGG